MTTTGPRVHVRIDAGVATVTFDNPPVNAWNGQMTDGLRSALRSLRADASVRAVVVTGAGEKAFSAGSDIVEMAGLLGPGEAVEKKLAPQQRIFAELASFPRPTIAALNGYTLGGGLEIAVCCDLVVAEEHISIGSPEITLGLFPSSGGTFRVARRIGAGRAKYMQLLGTPVDASTALSWGLVNEVVPQGHSLTRAYELAQVLSNRPATALTLCKAMIDAAHDLDETELISASLRASEKAFTSAEAAEGIRAFQAKRKPDFRRISALRSSPLS
ncbi:enoyl-CoA hydratase/carnithine racemase [Nocardia nova SH22a]|uniref:Probable enoyl-CoA hydratase EchA17 n=1 Tax=Nocardia nova SH22a TaxID=1415166 RepID=W5TES0_9NOCA|nr:enoyl-CoA hydratase-related protein [Nocardia nova]AHH17473.1 enoyl-CoA hydratase/carnithine racemase [Nocardia nova SH22a]